MQIIETDVKYLFETAEMLCVRGLEYEKEPKEPRKQPNTDHSIPISNNATLYKVKEEPPEDLNKTDDEDSNKLVDFDDDKEIHKDMIVSKSKHKLNISGIRSVSNTPPENNITSNSDNSNYFKCY